MQQVRYPCHRITEITKKGYELCGAHELGLSLTIVCSRGAAPQNALLLCDELPQYARIFREAEPAPVAAGEVASNDRSRRRLCLLG